MPCSVISQFDYTYRPDGAIDTWTIDQGSGASTWAFGYDGSRQLVSAKRTSGSTVLEDLSYGYDKAGNRIQAGSGTAAPQNFEVNNLNQLVSERDHGATTIAGFVDEPAKVTINGQPAKVTSADGGAPFRFEGVVALDAGTNNVVVQATDGRNNVATKTYAVAATGTAKTFTYDAGTCGSSGLRTGRLFGSTGGISRTGSYGRSSGRTRACTSTTGRHGACGSRS